MKPQPRGRRGKNWMPFGDGLRPFVAIGSTILGHFHDMEQHGDFYSLALLVSTFQSLNLL
jgi:hypothetical protein